MLRTPLLMPLLVASSLVLTVVPASSLHTATSTVAAESTFAVLTQHNDNSRSGLDLSETTLTTANVRAQQFGKVFSRAVDGQLYAQPLYVPNLTIPGQGTHNVVFAATTHDSVYAFDADDPHASTPLWQTNLGPAIPVPDPCFGAGPGVYTDITGEVGIISTPVIDWTSNTLYVLAATKDAPSGAGNCNPAAYVHRLHALDLATGQEKFGGPVAIQADAPGSGPDSSGGRITFNNMQELQRAALLLANGEVYIAFASYADTDPYHGWILGYDAATLQQRAVFLDSPDPDATGAYEGGIWQSGQGLSADANGYIYANTGDGNWDAASGGGNFGDSIVKLSPSLQVVDWFTPYNQDQLSSQDLDLGSSGALLMPGGAHVLAGGKEGVFYLLNSNSLGHYHAGDDSQIPQSFRATVGHIHGSPICWNGPGAELCYVWGEYDYLKAYAYANGQFTTTSAYQSAMKVPDGMPGGFLSISSNGNAAGTGIIWASTPLSGDANKQTVSGILRAFDATTLQELWNSEQNGAQDSVGNFAKFATPMIANGKVYLGTFSGTLDVYGLLPSSPPTPTATATPPAGSIPYNNLGTSSDGAANGASFDIFGNSYSAQALATAGAVPGQPFTTHGVTFTWPSSAAGAPDNIVAQGQTITLTTPTAGAQLAFLGAATSGPSSGAGTLTYADGSTQPFTLTMSDWTLNGGATKQPVPGNSVAIATDHRNTQDGGAEHVGAYVFFSAVDMQPGKALASVTLPAAISNGELHITALAVSSASAVPSPTPVVPNISLPMNNIGSSDDGLANGASFDRWGYSYSIQALAAVGLQPGRPVTVNGATFTWPTPAAGGADNLLVQGQTLTLAKATAGTALGFLGAATNGPSSGSGTLTYGDGTTQPFTLSLSDWTLNGGGASGPIQGDSVVATTEYRNTQSGSKQGDQPRMFYTEVPLQDGKQLESISLPSGADTGELHIFAVTIR